MAKPGCEKLQVVNLVTETYAGLHLAQHGLVGCYTEPDEHATNTETKICKKNV